MNANQFYCNTDHTGFTLPSIIQECWTVLNFHGRKKCAQLCTKASLHKGRAGKAEACNAAFPLFASVHREHLHCPQSTDLTLAVKRGKSLAKKFTLQLGTLEPRTWLAVGLQHGSCQGMMPFSPRRASTLLSACPGLLSLPIPWLLFCHPAGLMLNREQYCPH